MKALILFLLVFICTFFSQAQEKPDKFQSKPFDKKSPGQQYKYFDPSPPFKLPDPEAPSLTDSLVKKGRNITGADQSSKDFPDYFNMPVVKPGPEFSSNMPIMVPDSSVHYFIQQRMPGKEQIQPEKNN